MKLRQYVTFGVLCITMLAVSAGSLWAADLQQASSTNIYLPVVSDNADSNNAVLEAAETNNLYSLQNIDHGGITLNSNSNVYNETHTSAGRDCPPDCDEWNRAYYIFDISELPVEVSISNVSLPHISRWRGVSFGVQPITVHLFNADNFDSMSPQDKYNRINSDTPLGTIEFSSDWSEIAHLSSSMQNSLGDRIETYRQQNVDSIGIGIQRSPESGTYVRLTDSLPNLQLEYEPTELCNGHTPTIYGTEGDDVINGTSQVDVIHGLGGNDTIKGKAGFDIICGGPGNDILDGGDGNDKIYGDEGNDTIRGGWKNDSIQGGAGNDTIYGEAGWDNISGGDGDDYIEGNDGEDQINGGNGKDRLHGGWETDSIRGGPGDDYITGGLDGDLIRGDEGNDTIDGENGKDLIYGGDGNDTIRGGGKADDLHGDAGDDRLYGEGGRDDLDGGTGTDYCNGGAGSDDKVNCE